MGLMYDFTFTVINTGSQAVDVTGKGPMEPFGPVNMEPGDTYVHIESVNVCGLGSLTVSFAAMGDGGDCAGEDVLTHTFIPLTSSPTSAPITPKPTEMPTPAPTEMTVTAPPATGSPTGSPTSQPTPCIPDVDYCSQHEGGTFDREQSCDECVKLMNLIDSWCGKNWDQWCVATYAKCCPLSACPNEDELIGAVDPFECDRLNAALAGEDISPYIPPVFRRGTPP
jgi:hypothetical protein